MLFIALQIGLRSVSWQKVLRCWGQLSSSSLALLQKCVFRRMHSHCWSFPFNCALKISAMKSCRVGDGAVLPPHFISVACHKLCFNEETHRGGLIQGSSASRWHNWYGCAFAVDRVILWCTTCYLDVCTPPLTKYILTPLSCFYNMQRLLSALFDCSLCAPLYAHYQLCKTFFLNFLTFKSV